MLESGMRHTIFKKRGKKAGGQGARAGPLVRSRATPWWGVQGGEASREKMVSFMAVLNHLSFKNIGQISIYT